LGGPPDPDGHHRGIRDELRHLWRRYPFVERTDPLDREQSIQLVAELRAWVEEAVDGE
jgi:hypothetical protein